MCYLCVIIYYQDVEVAVGLRLFTDGIGYFGLFFRQDFFWLQMFLT